MPQDVTDLWDKLTAKVSSLEGVDTGSIEGFANSVLRIISTLQDIPLLLWRAVNSILGRLSLWFALASIVAGAVIGAFFGGAGAIPGTLAGAKFALAAGQGMLLSFVAAEIANIGKAVQDLIIVPQTPDEQDEDYSTIADSAIALGITALLMLLVAIAARLAGAARSFIQRICGRANRPNAGTVPPAREPTPPAQEPTPSAQGPESSTKGSAQKRSGKEIGESGAAYEEAVQQRTGGKSEIIEGREIDSVTDQALIQAKDVNPSSAKNFLNKSTRNQIKATIEIARSQGKRAEFWFKNEPLPEIRAYIEGKGGIVVDGLGE